MCPECIPFFELIDPEERCPYCFCESERRAMCQECREKKRWILPVLAALEKRGPITTLVNRLSLWNAPSLATTAASFMAVQFSKMGWQRPDYIIPIKRSLLSTCFKGKSAAYYLAKELSCFLEVPLKTSFKRGIEDKIILLVDCVMDRDGRIASAGEKLFERYPRKVYAMTLCC